jgi:hypothetical protein
VDNALDCATDVLTTAAVASTKRSYRCGRCQASVILKGGPNTAMRRHFAHAQGQADPDCDDYFPSVIAFTGRRAFHKKGAAEHDDSSRSSIYFAMEPTGPKILLSLPPSPLNDEWTGSVDVIAHRIERRLFKRHLIKGSSVLFPLSDGQWSISVSGFVSEDYISRIDMGPGSLESRLNLFDATRALGQQIGPSQPLRLGDAVWIVTRDGTIADLRPDSISISERHRTGAWEILYVQLPDEASSDVASEISRWLQRPIRNRQAKLWIESPWPIATRNDGVPILPRLDEGITLEADQAVDIEIRSPDGYLAHSVEQSKELHWRDPKQGPWAIFVNGKRFGKFETTDEAVESVAALRVVAANGSTFDFFQYQDLINQHATPWVDSDRLQLAWSDGSIGRLIHIDNAPLRDPDVLGVEVSKSTSTKIHADNLGNLNWLVESIQVDTSSDHRISPDLLERAQWLTGMTHLFRSITPTLGIRLTFKSRATHPVLEQLQGTYWPFWLQPQIEAFRAQVESIS